MADSTISNLPANTAVDPVNDVLPIVNNGVTKKASPQGIVNSAFPQVPFTPTGGISSTTVNAAIAELDTEKANTSTVNAALALKADTTALPTAMDSATAQAGTSTTAQTVSASVLKAGALAATNTIYLSSSNTGAVNSALIQSALNIGGTVNVEGSGVFPLDSTLVIGSNTNLYVSDLVTLRAGLSTTGSLLKNMAMTLTPVTCSIGYVVDDTFATVTLTNHGYLKGDFVYLSGATDPVFRGCLLVTNVTSSSIFVVSLIRLNNNMTTGVVPGTTKCVKADSNFNVIGGKWDYSWIAFPFNQNATVSINDICMWSVGAARFSIKNITGIDTKKFLIGIQGCTDFFIEHLGGILSSDVVKVYGPSYGGKISNITAQSAGDDVVTFQNAESSIYNYTMPFIDGGDVINMDASNIGGKTTQRGVGIFSYRPTDGMIDLINLSNVSIQSGGAVLAVDGSIGYTGNIGVITYTNISGNYKTNPLFVVSGGGAGSGPMSIKNMVFNNPIYYGKANVGKMFVGSSNIASDINATINGGYFQYGDSLISTSTGQGLVNYTFNGMHVNSGWSLFNLATNCKLKWTNGVLEGNIGQDVVICGQASTLSEVTFENLNITAIISNFAIVQNGASLKLTMKNVKFTTTPSVFIWNTNGTSTVDIYAENVNLAGAPIIQNDAGAVTNINSWGEGLVIDVINLTLTKGQKAWHSSVVANRNATNQQGPAFCNGSNWYALGTGVGGINTFIR